MWYSGLAEQKDTQETSVTQVVTEVVSSEPEVEILEEEKDITPDVATKTEVPEGEKEAPVQIEQQESNVAAACVPSDEADSVQHLPYNEESQIAAECLEEKASAGLFQINLFSLV